MNTNHERDEHDSALLLDLADGSSARAGAERRLTDEPAFRRAFGDLQEVACALEGLAADLHLQAGEIDIVDDVSDAVCHLEWEALDCKERPFYGIEQQLERTAQDLTGGMPPVALVDSVVECAAASEKTDAEVEFPFAALSGALNALGDDMAAALPPVDLLDNVIEKLPPASKKPANVVPLRARPMLATPVVPARSFSWKRYACWAAAVVLCVTGTWWAYQQSVPSPPEEIVAETNELTPPVLTNDRIDEDANVAPEVENDDVVVAERGDDPAPSVKPEKRRRTAPKQSESLTLQEAINERRRALINNLNTFEQLAGLSAAEASRMLQEMNLSQEALIGAAQFLSPEDAAEVLRLAVLNDPDNETLKYALARSLAGNPDNAAERQDQLEGLLALNSENSLPHYMLAVDYMARGDIESGLDALARGASLSEASPYTLENMRQREAVLRASGLDSDVARYLAVTTAGTVEMGDIAALRNELLDYGAYYEEQGDTDTAQQIYNAVNQLGVQLTEGADMAIVQQAGLETQQNAMSALQGIFEVLQQPDTVAVLGNTIGVLAQSILEVTQYVDSAQHAINNPQSTSTDWNVLIQQIFARGDTNIANLIGP